MNGYVLQQAKFVLYYPQKVFNLPNVVVNVILMTILWSFIYVSYIKVSQVLTKPVKTRQQFLKLNQNSIWHFGCCLLMILLTGISLHSHNTTQNISNQEPNHYAEIVFAVICAFHLHRLCLHCKTNGLDSIALRWLIATVAFSLSYGARCLRIGVRFVLIWSITAFLIEIICLLLSMTEMLWKKRAGVYLSVGIISFFCIIWAWLYLYIYPLFVLLPVTSLNITNSSVSLISLLLLALWSEFFLDVFTSPVRKFLWMLARRSFPQNLLGSVFLSHKDELKEKLLLIRKRAKEKEDKINNRRLQKEQTKRSGPKNSQAVMQTIKCVLLLKKKLRRMREKKHLEECSSTST